MNYTNKYAQRLEKTMFELRWLEYEATNTEKKVAWREKKLQCRYRRAPDITSMDLWTEWMDVPTVSE